MAAAIAAIVVSLISGPLMWLLYRLDRNNTEQHGKSMDLIKSVKEDIGEVKNMQVWMDLKLDQHKEQFDLHIEQKHNAS